MCSLSKSKINTRLVSLAVSYLSAALLRKSSSSCDGTIKQKNERSVFFRFPPPSPEVWTWGAPVTNWVSLPAPESVSPNQPREELSSNLQPAAHTVLILKMEEDLAALRIRNHLSSQTELWTKADIILKVIRSGEFDSIVVNFLFLWLSVNIQSHKSWCSELQ